MAAMVNQRRMVGCRVRLDCLYGYSYKGLGVPRWVFKGRGVSRWVFYP